MANETGYRCNIQPGYVDGEDLGEAPGTTRPTLIVELVDDGLKQLVDDLDDVLNSIELGRPIDPGSVQVERLVQLYDCLKAWSDR